MNSITTYILCSVFHDPDCVLHFFPIWPSEIRYETVWKSPLYKGNFEPQRHWGALLMNYRTGAWANTNILSLFTLRYYWHNPIKKYRKLDSIFKSRIKSSAFKILSLHYNISNFESQLGKWDMVKKPFCSINLNITFENFLKLIKVLSTRWFVTLNTAQDFLNSSLVSSF